MPSKCTQTSTQKKACFTMESLFKEKKLIIRRLSYHICPLTPEHCFIQQRVHPWGQLFSAKNDISGDKLNGVVRNIYDRILRKIHTDSNIPNKRHPPPSPCWLPICSGLPISENNTSQPLHKNYLQILHDKPKNLLVTHLWDINPHPKYQLPGPTDIYQQPRPYFLQDLPEVH